MKTILLTLGLAAVLTLNARATVVEWYANPGVTLADNSAAGSTFSSGTIGNSGQIVDSVNVLLDISGGYNGDLYGYLVYSVGGTTVSQLLLNRVGGGYGAVGGVSGFGSGATPMSFADLQTYGVTFTGGGTGADIQTTTAVAGNYVAAGGALNSTFGGLTSGGTWTLFLADLGSGDQSTLVSWGLQVNVVPEPATWALLIFGTLVGIYALVGRRVRRQPVA